MELYPKLEQTLTEVQQTPIQESRKLELAPLIQYITQKLNNGDPVNLNFICTHNSRRSQFSQVWAQVASDYYGIDIGSYSGGVEITAFNPRAINSLKEMGFEIQSSPGSNPTYEIKYAKDRAAIIAFSKIFSDEINPKNDFAAVMTCDHADKNCPFIPGAEVRLPLKYEDPKLFDDTELERQMYRERSIQIASELFYVFGMVQKQVSQT
ncbi:low molecular weight phosphatase family protein [Algoriphagus halophilus]|uniref:Arsenate reductase n=1 Tax=Algoriphagus halophilus TaxID=226505 RepID=A0A1N6DJP9_9BACT|nr:protein-tyrosine-phosphatase [Algoriphagus halophilus]SIN71059.1 arsenate reductase [Algoriphagus halophilus]